MALLPPPMTPIVLFSKSNLCPSQRQLHVVRGASCDRPVFPSRGMHDRALEVRKTRDIWPHDIVEGASSTDKDVCCVDEFCSSRKDLDCDVPEFGSESADEKAD